MFWFGDFRHRIALKMLQWRVIIRSHPLRVQITLSFLASVALVIIFRRYLWTHVPIWLYGISHPLFVAAQTHPMFGRRLHVAFNAVPDMAFALLALPGLAYLVPKSWIDKLEDLIWVRVFLIVLFITFGFSAIIINAIKSENQEFKDGQNDKRMTLVLTDVIGIQNALAPKNVHMTEAERRQHLLTSLRDEYVLLPGKVDPEVLSGTKPPPSDWVNVRLHQMGETFSVKNQPTPRTTTPQITQIIQPQSGNLKERTLLLANEIENAGEEFLERQKLNPSDPYPRAKLEHQYRVRFRPRIQAIREDFAKMNIRNPELDQEMSLEEQLLDTEKIGGDPIYLVNGASAAAIAEYLRTLAQNIP